MSHTSRMALGFHKFIPAIGLVFAILTLAGRCLQQDVPDIPAIKLNTASAGVRQEDIEAAVKLICPPGDITRSKSGNVSGCRVCPKGTDFYGEKGIDWGLYAETPGHFTSARDDNLLLDGAGCDPHSMNFGGGFMFVIRSGQPHLLTYDQGLVTSQCRKSAFADGRDFLVCKGGWGAQGENFGTVFMASFGADGKPITTTLITLKDTTGTCDGNSSKVVQESEVREIQLSPAPSGQITGMTVTATLGNVECSHAETVTKSGKLPGSLKAYKIEFSFDGKRFRVVPSSRATFDRFQAASSS